MSKVRRTNQGGSVVGIVIIGVILASLLVGSIYYLNIHGDQVRKEQAIAAAEKQAQEAEKSKQVVSVDQSGTVNGATDATSDSGSTPSILPVTGPELSVSGLAGAYLMTYAVVGYFASRRQLVRYL